MMKTLITILLLSSTVLGATKADLKARLEATGKYVEVGTPIKLRPIQGQGGLTAARYYIAVLKSRTDSLVVKQGTFYLWVIDDTLPTEKAFFLNGDPTLTPPAPTEDFIATIRARMVTANVQGTIITTDSVGNARWAIVERYRNGTDPSTQFTSTQWKITRTDGTTWSVQQLEP